MPQEGSITSADGINLHTCRWPLATDQTAVGHLILVHGLGEHCGRYEHVAKALNQVGVSVHAIDHRGHGRSGGLRGHVDHWDQYLSDLRLLVAKVRSEDEAPIFVLGHSMGGLIVLRLLQQGIQGISGAVLSNPSLKVAFDPPKLKVLAGRLLAKVLPRLRLDNELDTEAVCRDQSVLEAYTSDPLVHRHISTRWYTAFIEAQEAANAEMSSIQLPTLWIVSGADRLCHPGWNQETASSMPSERTELRVFPDAFHEAHNGPEKDVVLSNITEWIVSHCQAVPA